MNKLLRLAGCGGLAVLTGLVQIGSAASPTVEPGDIKSLAAWVDGVEVPPITTWEGGDPRIRYSSTLPLTPVGVDCAPLTVDCNFAPAPVLQRWIKQFCARQTAAHRLVISEIDPDATGAKAMVTREYVNARITEVRWFLSSDNGYMPSMKITFQADSVRKLPIQNPTAAPVAGTKALYSWASVPSQKAELVVSSSGPARFTARFAGTIKSPYWAVRDAIIGDGTTLTTQPSSMAYTFSSGPSSSSMFGFRLDLTGMQLVRFTRDATEIKSFREADAEFLVETVAVTTEAEAAAAAAPPLTALPVNPPLVTSTLTPAPSPTADPAAPETGGTATPIVAQPPSTTTVLPSIRDPKIPTTTPTLSATPRPAGLTSTTSDVGLRDPVLFPRPDGLARQQFDARISSTRIDESAQYTTKRAFDELLKQYEEMATKDGWTQTSRSETGTSPTDRMTMTYWTRNGAEADLRVYGRISGVEVSLAVSVVRTTKAPN